MTIIVTGATSFVGKAAADRLEACGHHVIRLRHSFEEEIGRLPEHADVWLHFAWAGAGSKDRSDPAIQQYNTDMTLSAIKEALRLNCGRFIFAGSQAEYGHAQDGCLKSEYGGVSPVSEYGKAKLKVHDEAVKLLHELRELKRGTVQEETDAEYGIKPKTDIADEAPTDRAAKHYVNAATGSGKEQDAKPAPCGMQYIHMRIFSVYGPGDHAGSLINTLIEGFAGGDTIALGNCTQSWNYMYIDDAAEAIRLLCERGEEGIYNVASDDTRPLKSYVEEIHKLLGGRGRAGFGMREDNAEGPADLSPDISLITALGFKPKTGFDEGIHNCLNAGKNNKSKRC